ncbi:hypothetical protein HBA54_16030 [Pelagibius litoralis]|uniref:Lipoprotein n=1 Tax=Pelagibius litoralis TaxID=374515 RepID=A0A967EZA1_9PROT|nr:hypothetical protein [Pelagibius litoralis]NIA70115.1 hypothetical protein [Pelagibius litoralis]
MKRGLPIGPLAVIFLSGALAACSTLPFPVQGSDAAVAEATAKQADVLPRLQPYAFGLCYSPVVNEDAEIEEEAAYQCDGGRLIRQDEDFFWNECSLSQPHRVSYVCFPPDKAKRRITIQPAPQPQ